MKATIIQISIIQNKMNRIVLIGNRFDLAHDLNTSYKEFIYWYWKQRVNGLHNVAHTLSDDSLCELEITNGETWSTFYFRNSMSLKKKNGEELYKFLTKHKDTFRIGYTPFFEKIHKALETKLWVDIENEYYRLLTGFVIRTKSEKEVAKLNQQLAYIKEKLIEYLIKISEIDINPINTIKTKIYAPIKKTEVAIAWQKKLKEYIDWCMEQGKDYWKKKYGNSIAYSDIDEYEFNPNADYPRCFMTPDNIMLLNFNYTRTAELYVNNHSNVTVNYIHGNLSDPESIIFGYGDELDKDYPLLKEVDDDGCLCNVKSINYLNSDNYRKFLDFIESDPYQVVIMGHSCGNSDRTLLNKLFEHKNCVSIKPYFYIKKDGSDNYLELVQSIHRNFTDMNLMRDRVVNKLYCETLT